jgi:lipid II:glycine glycyltransferase (peptidoglycan interpeptide bridge formation enzyme)
MSYNISLEANSENWKDFVQSHPNGNFFQSFHFISFITGIKGYQPVTLFALNTENSIEGLLCCVIQKEGKGLKAYFSSRLIVWGGPLVTNNNAEIASLLIDYLTKHYSKNCVYIEFRNSFDLASFQSIFAEYHFNFKPHLNCIVKTDSLPLIKKRISESKLRQIKTTLKNGVIISEPQSEIEIQKFYSLLEKLYREKVKKPIPPLSFFLKFYHSEKLGKTFLIKKGNMVLGGIVCPIFKNKIIYEWYICSNSNLENIYPGVLATWAPIEYAANNGFDMFDFMGAGSPDKDYGVRDFKLKFGGELVDYGRYLCVNKPLFYNVGKIGLKILSYLHKV